MITNNFPEETLFVYSLVLFLLQQQYFTRVLLLDQLLAARRPRYRKTTKGTRPGGLKALSHVTVAQPCGSWLPCTITTTGKDSVQTWGLMWISRICRIKYK
uniref:SFRICE_026319 n=1 Tax=Spodoptera frugiperda TaxID=7108 RepID=A0A2H1VNR2_SPOFR